MDSKPPLKFRNMSWPSLQTPILVFFFLQIIKPEPIPTSSSQVLSDKQSTQVKARKNWKNLISTEDTSLYNRRYKQTYGFGFLHSVKNIVCSTRNHNLSDGNDFFSMRTILQLWNNNTSDIKSILDSKTSKN